ncbi:MAG: S16 family serine protease [Clostridia bacterium]|nr:S16 family serine protease [Clostridia bacterium]
MDWLIFIAIQVAISVALYFIFARRNRACSTPPVKNDKATSKEFEEISKARERSLTIPLTELARPACMEDIVGQGDAIRALRAALCGHNPQHVIIYGPPGVGKTCAARLVLDEAKACPMSPFDEESAFVEVDATCVRFDERAIADPLIGSVHDPIYQGAGQYGSMGVPQPKPGAVSRAHCGVLFLDEIGELHPAQMNKLLKVLEDRCVHFDSAYYSKENRNIPAHIHDIFENGLPADFRLVGATTRQPEELPSALRSRCVEIFFKALSEFELASIARRATEKTGCPASDPAVKLCAECSLSGRDAVNIMQLAGGLARLDGRQCIERTDVEWVATTCRFAGRAATKLPDRLRSGIMYGLGVSQTTSRGYVMEIECVLYEKRGEKQDICTYGIIDEEQIDGGSVKLMRRSTARASIENAVDAVYRRYEPTLRNYDIRYNIPGGMPVDGPSAGLAFALALYGALFRLTPAVRVACTGEITCSGEVRPVGAVEIKVQAALAAGADLIIVPASGHRIETADKVVAISDMDEAIKLVYNTCAVGQIDQRCEYAEYATPVGVVMDAAQRKNGC